MSRARRRARAHIKAWVRGVAVDRDAVGKAVRELIAIAGSSPRLLRCCGFVGMAVRRCVVVDKLRVCVTEASGEEEGCMLAGRAGCPRFAVEAVSIGPGRGAASLEDAVEEAVRGGRAFAYTRARLPPTVDEAVRGLVMRNLGRVIDEGLFMRDGRYAKWGFSHMPVRVRAPGGVEVRYRLTAFSVPPLRVFTARVCSATIGAERFSSDCVLRDLLTVFVVEPLAKPIPTP